MHSAKTAEFDKGSIWWSNGLFFVGVHVATLIGVYHHPFKATAPATLALAFILWQAACFGITVGYHRLHSHRSFRAGFGVRVFFALLGASAIQGSIKWWSLRHRLHHRYTDDPVHDPYAATRGLFWSHMGWIFYKPSYERMALLDRSDLDNDPVVQLQHENYVPLAIFTGFVFPILIGTLWNDSMGAFIWAGLVARVCTWHCTFLINSLAHWDGLQPYSDENTSRTNLVLALLTCGEGNHNFHAFPQDFRSGPAAFDWDPSKWVILMLHRFGLATGLRRARDQDLVDAKLRMHAKSHEIPLEEEEASNVDLPLWTLEEAHTYAAAKKGSCLLLIDGNCVDATVYMGEHPGGAALLRKYAVRAAIKTETSEPSSVQATSDTGDSKSWQEATWAFDGGMNQHSSAARRRMQELTVARLEL